MATLVKAGRLLDPRTGNALSPVAVLIENGKIKEIGAPSRVEADAPAGAAVIDLGGATVLPGLIDCHTHLFLDIVVPPEEELRRHANGEFAPDVFQNVDVLKVTAGDDLSLGELAAVAEEAHRQHLKLAAHAADAASIQMAIEAGADSIEHGNDVTTSSSSSCAKRASTWT
jgi:imidazolonepropionase-like amidohydrolase